ncbi:hypothetical protein JTE90_016913 [Oedothorax gibbosus]|uniref:DNA-binding protein D-ETS-4 n=1 Tax=Oedothorax gibbosus TaxID=931172 RepID=A0AAV6UT32_9ARAC|nr:hypothetical protein JTE90_016913 [Oedothorax gibbosus]
MPHRNIIRPQLVPNPGSPLSLETWCMADFESWLCDNTTLLRSNQHNNNLYNNLEKLTPYHNSVHVNIPSPGMQCNAAESPTLYDSPPGKNYGGPPPYIHIKQEFEEDLDYQCPPGMRAIDVKREEDCLVSEGLTDQMEQLRNLAVEQAAKEIHVACEVLGISPDPALWSLDEAKSWILWILNQYNFSTDVLQHFNVNGMGLCAFSEAYFRQKVPNGGDILYAQLDIWKTAACLQRQTPNPQPQQQPQHAPSPPQQQGLLAFRPEDSVLDMSGILDQWSTPYHRMSPPAGSRGGNAGTMVATPDSSSSVASPEGSHDFSSEGMQSDDEISDESCDTDRCPTTGRGSTGRPGSHSHIHLWQFLKELLCQPHLYGSCIRWLDRPKGIFKIEDSVRVARLWGKRKNRPAMNYDKLSRSIRQYYKKGIMKKTERSQRLVYQFCHPYGL